MNLKRGLFRLWLTSTIAWIGFVSWDSWAEINYTYRYIAEFAEVKQEWSAYLSEQANMFKLERDELLQLDRARAEKERREQMSEYGQKLREIGIISPPHEGDSRLTEVEANFKHYSTITEPSPPSWGWVAKALLPPPIAAIFVFALAALLRWLVRGFVPHSSRK